MWLKNEAPAQTQRHGGIPLTLVNGLYAAADDLGDEGRGVGDERDRSAKLSGDNVSRHKI